MRRFITPWWQTACKRSPVTVAFDLCPPRGILSALYRLVGNHNLRSKLLLSERLSDSIRSIASIPKGQIMKIVVIGGSGFIGSRLVNTLHNDGQEVVAASPTSGVNSVTGEGLAKSLKGASVVVDVTNAPSREDADVMNFFETSTQNLLAFEAAEGVGHHVALSVVGTERMLESGYFRAKISQEKLIRAASIPHSIVRATQFYEFVNAIADFSTDGNKVHLPPVLFQPMAADDVATAVSRIALGPPLNGTVEIAGPETFRLDEVIRRGLAARRDSREVVADPHARYYDIAVTERTLVPEDGAQIGKIRFEDWLAQGNLK